MTPEPRTRGSLRALATMVALTFREAPALTVLGLVVVPVGWLTTQLNVLWLKRLTDAVVAQDAAAAGWSAVLIALTVGGMWLVNGVDFKVRPGIQERAGFAMERRLTELSAKLPGLEHHERPDYQDRLELIRQQRGLLGNAMNAVVNNVGLVLRFAFTLVLLARLDPLLLLLPLAGLPRLLATAAAQRRARQVSEETAETFRRLGYFVELASDASAGKEIRVFNLEDELISRHRRDWDWAYAKNRRLAWTNSAFTASAAITETTVFLAAIAFVTVRALRGEASIGDVVLAVGLTGQVGGNVAQLAFLTNWLLSSLQTASRFMWLLDYSAARAEPVAFGSSTPSRITRGISVEDVSFAYPGTETLVLEHVDLTLPAGAVVALVGENGSGKTTLVKLLCRFYEPTSGRITLDGMDIANFTHEDWRAATSAAFQDFAKLELLARETVGVGDLPRINDEDAVLAALDRAGASEVPGRLPSGLSTQLGKQWDNGVELSVGQWQKLALGRALMRDVPLLYVFDEPTASLDADTEHALFERFAAEARTNQDTGTITILVSHRFSTVRGADLIVVVDNGRIVEHGSHEQLIAHGALYAELYELQARAYR